MWSMEVFQGDIKLAEKFVEVKEYELPLFEVELDAPSHVSFNQEAFLVTVRAHYTFGKPISGNCLLKIISKGERPTIEREFPLIDGKKELSLQLSEFGKKIQRIQINATIQDTVTLTQRTVSKTVSILAKRYLIDTPPMAHECDGPSDTFTYRARITHLNATPVDVDEEIYVKLDVDVNEEPSKIVSYADENGDIEAEITCSNYTNVNITIEYNGETSLGEIRLSQRSNGSQGGVYVRTQK
ncbi:CD109 antigen-like [Rhagoletis pomonella]|uniref:CD109 antigen-like n=1 Tax=Rhagoletis pomonella TaxID=28610 RepID=UPI00177F85CF|nr:CD109 antigen-like [Rhagoletis pomonella]